MRSRQATSRLTCPARMSFTVINRFAMAHLHSHLAGHVSLDVACLDRSGDWRVIAALAEQAATRSPSRAGPRAAVRPTLEGAVSAGPTTMRELIKIPNPHP